MKKVTFIFDDETREDLEKGLRLMVTHEVFNRVFAFIFTELKNRDAIEVVIGPDSILLKDKTGEIIKIKKEKAFFVRDDRDIKLD